MPELCSTLSHARERNCSVRPAYLSTLRTFQATSLFSSIREVKSPTSFEATRDGLITGPALELLSAARSIPFAWLICNAHPIPSTRNAFASRPGLGHEKILEKNALNAHVCHSLWDPCANFSRFEYSHSQQLLRPSSAKSQAACNSISVVLLFYTLALPLYKLLPGHEVVLSNTCSWTVSINICPSPISSI